MTSLQFLTSARLQRFCLIDCSFVVEITPEKTVFNVNQALIKGAADSGGLFFYFHIIPGSFVWSYFWIIHTNSSSFRYWMWTASIIQFHRQHLFFAGVLKIELFFPPVPACCWVLLGGVVLAKHWTWRDCTGADSKTSPGQREGNGELRLGCNIPEKLSFFWTQLLNVSVQSPGLGVARDTGVSISSQFTAISTQVNWIEGIYSADLVVLMPHLTPSFESVLVDSQRKTMLSREASQGREV